MVRAWARVPWLGSNPVCLSLQMEVQSPPGTTIGHVLQTWHPFLPKFSIQDADRHTVLRVVGPCWTCGCGTDTNFEVSRIRGIPGTFINQDGSFHKAGWPTLRSRHRAPQSKFTDSYHISSVPPFRNRMALWFYKKA